MHLIYGVIKPETGYISSSNPAHLGDRAKWGKIFAFFLEPIAHRRVSPEPSHVEYMLLGIFSVNFTGFKSQINGYGFPGGTQCWNMIA